MDMTTCVEIAPTNLKKMTKKAVEIKKMLLTRRAFALFSGDNGSLLLCKIEILLSM